MLRRLNAKGLIAIFELCHLSAGVHQLPHPGPGWVGLWVDVQLHCVAGIPPGGFCLEGEAVSHDNAYFVIVRMNAFFHFNNPKRYAAMIYKVVQNLNGKNNYLRTVAKNFCRSVFP